MTHRIAVVGAGPSGLYAADALASAGLHVDVIERLPVPFGLVRYGVAPDHHSIRSVRDTLAHVLDRDEVRLVAGVEVGTDVSVDELLAAYDAVVLTYGASRDRHLDVPGEDLPGSIAATDLVAWYCGHPDADREGIEAALAAATSAVVVGVGNVAVDVTRVLTAPLSRLEQTDMPQHVLDALARSRITDVHVLGRRGPAQATWTTKELKELAELDGVDVLVDAPDLELEPVSAALVESDRVVARNVDVIRSWADHALDASHKHIHLHFHARPAELRGDERVDTVIVERTTIDDTGAAHGTGETYELAADLVVRSVGYRGLPLEGVPFDGRRNVIPNVDGRVVTDDGQRRARPLRRRLDQARAHGDHRHEQEGRRRHGGLAARRPRRRRRRAAATACCRCWPSAVSRASTSRAGAGSTRPSGRWASRAAAPGRRCTRSTPCATRRRPAPEARRRPALVVARGERARAHVVDRRSDDEVAGAAAGRPGCASRRTPARPPGRRPCGTRPSGSRRRSRRGSPGAGPPRCCSPSCSPCAA